MNIGGTRIETVRFPGILDRMKRVVNGDAEISSDTLDEYPIAFGCRRRIH